MRVIFLQDVERVGHEGEIGDVADGYARNYLIPRGLAVKASRGAMLELEQRRSAIEKRQAEKESSAEALAGDLGGKTIVVKATAGEGQRLHGQVTAQQIADAVLEQLGFEIDRRDIEIAEPIRLLGDYLIGARLYKEVKAQLPISVVAAEGSGRSPDELPEEDQPQPKAAAEAEAEPEVEPEAEPEPETEVEADAEDVADEEEPETEDEQ